MQKMQDSVFTLVKTTNLSPAVFSFLQPTDDSGDKTPLGGILKDTKHGWLALGPKFCVVDLRTGMKVAARTFGATLSNNATVTSVVELPTPLTEHSQQLIVSLQCDDISIIVIININGSQILRCIQTDVVVTELAICDDAPDGLFSCFDGIVIAGTKRGEIFAFDLNRATLIQALKNISQGYEHLIQNEMKPTNLSFLPLDAVHRIEEQRELALENDHHLAVLLNENSFIEGQYIFRNPDGTVRMKANRDHIRVTVLEYIPQTGSVAVGFNFGAFQIWNLMTLDLEFTSQVNVECLPVTHFGFQEPCDDPRAFCYLWVVFSVLDRHEEEEFPLAVMYSLTYQGKRMLSDTKCLYEDFLSATIRFQVELSTTNEVPLLGGKCISCHSYSIKSTLGDEGEDSMLNLCQLVWESWAENVNSPMQYGMLLFDLDQWYKDQMPTSYRVESNAFLSASSWAEMSGGSGSVALHARLDPASVTAYSHATRLEEHFYPNSLQYNCICLNTSEVCVLSTIGIQRQIISSMEEVGPTVLLHPPRLYAACAACGLAPLYAHHHSNLTQEEQRRYLLSVALEARLARFLKRCAHDWATGSHSGVGCTLPFLVDWCWKRALELKENAKELTAPLFISSGLPDRNIVRCLEHCVQQLTQLTGLMDAILTKCCNLVVPDALSEMEEKHKGIGTVSLYFQVVQWLLRVGLLPERVDGPGAMSYPAVQLYGIYNKRRLKLNRIQDNGTPQENSAHKSCELLYIDQLLEKEFGGEIIHKMWINGGSECGGLYPPPSLYALLRLYLLPEIAEEHKHSLVLYLLVDYSMIYDDVRYETVIRRLMQFPTMFGLSNTAIKATQAFWHLDHRDFDFALDQLQCLTGNTLSEWQHNVVLSSLLAQRKTQAALQYLHVRKPAPIQNIKDGDYSKVNDHDKLEDWQSCCNLYLARGLVYEALDVIRMCVQNAGTVNDKTQVLNMFFKGCRNTGNLSKILSVAFLPFEEEVFIKYLENCNEPQTSNILIMYYLQQARYLEAERYNTKLRHSKPKSKDFNTSAESLLDWNDRDAARDNIVEAMCAALPSIAETVAHCAFDQRDIDWHVHTPKPLSVYVQAKSPQNKFTYKSTFIQDSIQNASETWMNRPNMRKGIKRLLNIEETPFICTPKLSRSRSIYTDLQSDSTPPKRARLNLTGTPKTPRSAFKVSDKLSSQMEKLLDMPEVQSPVGMYDRPETPHSILKMRRNSRSEVPSPCVSRYLEDTDDELEMETASNHTHYSDTTNKHLRFTIPTPTEPGSDPTPSPILSRKMPSFDLAKERERSASTERDKEMDISTADSYVTTASHAMNESNPLESPPKKLATEANVALKKTYKDSVRARRSFSISANSSLSDDPNTSIESIADIPFTLINPRYSGNRRRSQSIEAKTEDETETEDTQLRARQKERSMSTESTRGSLDEAEDKTEIEKGRESVDRLEVPKTPSGRRGIRATGESTSLRSASVTPERQDSPVITPLRSSRISRSRSKTPELSPRSSPLAVILEQPTQEVESEPHAERSTLSVPRSLRSRSRTPDRMEKGVSESPKLEAIKESPTKSGTDSPPASPNRPTLRSRSRTPEVEIIKEPVIKPSPRSLRSRSKTPEKLMSPKKDHSARTKKSLSRLVLEANTFAKTKQTLELLEAESASESKSENKVAIECTPMKATKPVPSLMDMTLSPIVNKSFLQSSNDSVLSESVDKASKDSGNMDVNLIPMPAFATLHETYFEKSVLRSYQSSVGDSSQSIVEEKEAKTESHVELIPLPAFTTIHEDFGRSVLHSYESSVAGTSQSIQEETPKKINANVSEPFALETPINTDFGSVLHSQQSSLADSDSTQPLNVSSLITDDSDVDMTETENQERAEQKEKEQIVDIEREIHEIEDDMSNDENESASGDESDEVTEEGTSSSDIESSADSSAANDDVVHVSSGDSDSDSDSSPPSGSDKPSSPISPEKLDEQVQRIMKTIKFGSESESSMDPCVESESNGSSQSNKVEPHDEKIDQKLNDIVLPKQTEDTTDPLAEMDNAIEKTQETIDPIDQAQVSLMTEDGSVVMDEGNDDTEMIEASNPLDQAQISLMTDDNSTVIEDITEQKKDPVKHTPQTEKVEKEIIPEMTSQTQYEKQEEIETSRLTQGEIHVQTKISEQISETQSKDTVSEKEAMDPLAQVSLMTEDNSEASDQELSLNYSDDKFEDELNNASEKPDMHRGIVEDVPKPEVTGMAPLSPKSKDVVDTSASETEIKEPGVPTKENSQKMDTKTATVQETYKPKATKETSKQETVKVMSKPETVEEASKTETVTEMSKQETVKVTSKPEIVKEASKTITDKETSKQETVKVTSKPETVKEASKTETVTEMSKQETVKVTSKPESVKEASKTATDKETSKQETVKVTSKPETVKEASKPEIVKETSKTETVKETSKIETVKDISKPEIITETSKTETTVVKETLELKPETVKEPKSKVKATKNEENKTVEKMETESQSEEELLKSKIGNVEKMDTATESQTSDQETVKPSRTRKRVKSTSSNAEIEPKEINEPKTPIIRKRAQSRTKSIEVEIPIETVETEKPTSSITATKPKDDEPKTRKRAQSRAKSIEVEIPIETVETEKPTTSNTATKPKDDEPKTRKRSQSRAKSTETNMLKEVEPKDIEPKTPVTRKRASKAGKPTEVDVLEAIDKEIIASGKTAMEEEPKTPITRKRAQSTASNQSEETTPENVTPSRQKTPGSTEVRKIVTRRMSREMRELNESNRSLDESASITPKRRNARKNTDDNDSVASGSSVASSLQSGESKTRRGRKSTLATKPDLSVIPEVLAEESREQSTLDVINEYSGTRRLTRHQKSMLETSRGLRPSGSFRASRSSMSEQEDEEMRPAFDLQPIDRISLLNKEAYDGPPDEDELQLSGMSPESIASDASKMRRSRMARAASEAKVVKAAKIHRRITSVDVHEESPIGSPALSGTDSPARERRASFTRAIEALHTPKGRRQSTDSRKSASPVESPAASDVEAPVTPSRRGRRASAQSNTSQSGRSRSKKMPVLEEVKEIKK